MKRPFSSWANFLAKVGDWRTKKIDCSVRPTTRPLHAEQLEMRELFAVDVTVFASDPVAHEVGSAAGSFGVRRFGSNATALTVFYTVSGTATNGGDYNTSNPLAGSVTIPAGQNSASISVTPVADLENEVSETVTITLSASPTYSFPTPSGTKATVTIFDGPPPAITITASDPIASESGGSTGQFTVSRDTALNEPLEVLLKVGGTASYNHQSSNYAADYHLLGGYATGEWRLTIGAGQANATITVTPIDDADEEDLESVTLTVLPSYNYEPGTLSSATVHIIDNDPPTITVAEGGTAVISRDWLLHEVDGQSPADITYHVVAGLVHGQLELASAAGVAIASFTQADIDADDVLYVHDGSYALNDSVHFTIEDGLGNETEIATLRVLVQRAQSWRNPTNPFNVFDDNYVDTLDLAMLVNDLFVNKSRELQPLAPGEKPERYVNINGDDFFDTLDLAFLVHHLQTTNLSDRTVDDEAPQQGTNAGGTVAAGGGLVLDADVLEFTDLQPLEEIRYTITTAPAAGRIESILTAGVPITTFTQADINARRIRYVHDGSAVDTDAFQFSIDDGRGNVLLEQQFVIEISAGLDMLAMESFA